MRLSHPRARLAAVGFAALLPFGLFVLPHAPAATTATTKTVTISYDSASGTLSVSLDPVKVLPGDQVKWESNAGVWSVVVPSDSLPFGAAARSKGIGAQKGKAAGLTVAANAKPGTYKYIVALYDGSEVHILDPDVIVGGGA